MPFSLYDSLLVNDADTYFKSLTDTASTTELFSKICASFHPIRIEKEDETICASFHPNPVRIRWDKSRYQRGLKLRVEFCETQTTK